MPKGDGTGPTGAGPLTGRAAGYCDGFDRPGFTGHRPGLGRGRGRGRGYRHIYHQTGLTRWQRAEGPAPEDRAQALRERARVLRENAEAMEKRAEQLREAEGEKKADRDG